MTKPNKTTEFEIDYHRKVEKYLAKQTREINVRFEEAIEKIKRRPFKIDDPINIDHLKAKLLCLHRYKLRSGKLGLRIIYDIDKRNRKISVIRFGPRGNVYNR